MATLLTPTVPELESERARLLAETPRGEEDLRARAEDFLLTHEEARLLRRLDEIDFLLGRD
ncbi:hypothetical protein OO014_04175 [Intrasporangium calvum]|uniref:Uncharacterized protein n=1 Tax=Intrasporangium calvum TaxID=53358 RepID=A0ABT5GDX2_9MICO|nr:hypothetical protein [Intrasporangium calvum]MDC5696443.1 hypothetical protein [Intrasporangium calvum]